MRRKWLIFISKLLLAKDDKVCRQNKYITQNGPFNFKEQIRLQLLFHQSFQNKQERKMKTQGMKPSYLKQGAYLRKLLVVTDQRVSFKFFRPKTNFKSQST